MTKKNWIIGVHMAAGKLAPVKLYDEDKNRAEFIVANMLVHGFKDEHSLPGTTLFYPPHCIQVVSLEEAKAAPEDIKVDEQRPTAAKPKRAAKRARK